MGETDCGGRLVLVLMGGAMLSKSLIQFSVDGRGCVPSLLFDMRQNHGEVMKLMVTSFKMYYANTSLNGRERGMIRW